MPTYIERKVDERSRLTASMKALFDLAAAAGRDLSDDEKRQLGEMETRTKILDSDIETFNRLAEASETARKIGQAAADRETAAAERRQAAPPAEQRRQVETTTATPPFDFGRTFVESEAFKAYSGSGRSRAVELPGPGSPEFRAAITTDAFGDLFKTEVWAGPPGPAQITPLLSLIAREQVSTSATVFLRWPEASDAGEVAEGAAKPEAELEPEEVPIALRTFAHWKAITRQALEDVPQIQSIVQTRLLRGVVRKLQAEAASTIAAQTPGTPVGAGTLLEGVRAAIAMLEEQGYEPNAIGLNPMDAAALDMAAMSNTVAGPVRTGGAWGLPYAPAAAFPAGTLYVADFTQAVTWFDRGNTQAYVTDSHADYFIRNQLVVLAEARAAFAVTEAPAIVKVSLTEPPTGGGG